MRADMRWVSLVKVLFYGLAVFAALLPFAVLVLDFGDPNHLLRFLVFPFVAVGLAITGKLLATGLHAVMIYIESRSQQPLTLDPETEQTCRARFNASRQETVADTFRGACQENMEQRAEGSE
jgi:hypothetical protein